MSISDTIARSSWRRLRRPAREPAPHRSSPARARRRRIRHVCICRIVEQHEGDLPAHGTASQRDDRLLRSGDRRRAIVGRRGVVVADLRPPRHPAVPFGIRPPAAIEAKDPTRDLSMTRAARARVEELWAESNGIVGCNAGRPSEIKHATEGVRSLRPGSGSLSMVRQARVDLLCNRGAHGTFRGLSIAMTGDCKESDDGNSMHASIISPSPIRPE
jgi:hypothetical protein